MNPLCFRSGRSVIAASRVIEVLEDMGLIDPEGSRAWPLPPETDRELARVDWPRVGAPHTGSRDGAVPARVMKELEAMAGSGDDGRLEEVLDRLAWYAPIHFSGERWGVYIGEHTVITLAGRIGARLPAGRITDQATAQDAIRSALYTLYFHEAFHHYVESFAIRVELVEKTSRYVPYHHRVYSRPTGDDEPVEEALACAEMLRRQKKESGLKAIHRDIRRATRGLLEDWIPTLPGGYRKGLDLEQEARFKEAQNRLSSQIQAGTSVSSGDEARWRLIRRELYRGICDCRRNTYLVGTWGSPPILRNLCRPVTG